MVQSSQNSPEVFIYMPSIVVKMLAISTNSWTTESRYIWCHRVGSPASLTSGERFPCWLDWFG